jgi:hypothetical protein
VESFELKDNSREPQEIIVKIRKDTPALDIKWIKDTLSEYDMFNKFTIV